MARFGDHDAVILGYVEDLHALLRAIDEAMPKDAVLYLEGTDIAPDIAGFLGARGAPDGLAIGANTIWPTPETFRMPLAGTSLADLLALAGGRPGFEVGDHVVVYRGDELLLWADDASDGWLQVARSLPAETIDRLRRELGPALGPPP